MPGGEASPATASPPSEDGGSPALPAARLGNTPPLTVNETDGMVAPAPWVPLARATGERAWHARVSDVAYAARSIRRHARHTLMATGASWRRRVGHLGRDLRRAGLWPGRFARQHPFASVAVAVALLLGAPLASFLATARPTAAARLTVGIGAQATQITAEKASTGAAPAFTSLLVQPSIEESNPGEISGGFIVLQSPSGFEFDTASPAASVTVAPLAGQAAGTCDTAANGTGSQAILTSVTSSAILVTVTRASSGTSKCLMTFSSIRVRPTTWTAPFSGSITKSTSGYTNMSSIAGVTDGVTSFGDIQTVPALWDATTSPTLSPLSLNRSQVVVNGSITATITLKDAYGNTLTTAPGGGIGVVTIGTKSVAPLVADCPPPSGGVVGAAPVLAGGAAVVTAPLPLTSAGSLYVYACLGTTLFTSTAQVTVTAAPTITGAEIGRQLSDSTTSNGTTIGTSAGARPHRTVTVRGTGFADGVTAAFDGNGLTAGTVTLKDASTLTISTTIAAGAGAGGRSVTVTNPDGGSVSLANAITLSSPPSAPALSKSTFGSGAINVPINLIGTNFLPGARVTFVPNNGDITFTTVVNSATQVTLTMTIASTARETAERRSILIDNRDESGEVEALTQMQINAPPAVSVSGISPGILGQGAGSLAGSCGAGAPGVTVTVPGTGFSADANTGTVQASFANTSFDVTTTVTSISSTFLALTACVTGTAATGARELRVVNGDGGRVTVPNALEITGSPRLVSASEATIGQGATERAFTFTGAGFSPTASLALKRVSSGGGSFTQCGMPTTANTTWPGTLSVVTGATVTVTARTTTALSAKVTVGADALTGPVWIGVDNADGGTEPGCALNGALVITPRPTATSVSPSYLNPPSSGSTTFAVSLAGTGFGSGTTVAFGPASGQLVADVTASGVQVASATQLTFRATVPSSAFGGPRDLTITNLDGGTKVVAGAISIVTTGAVTITPASVGAGAVSALLTITGTGLNPASTASFASGGTDVTGTVITAGAIAAGASGTRLLVPVTIASSAAPGTYSMTITSPEGLATTGTFAVAPGPRIAAIGRTVDSASTTTIQYGQAATARPIYLAGGDLATVGGTPTVVAVDGGGTVFPAITVSGVTVAAGGASLVASVAVDANAVLGTYALRVVNPDLGRTAFAAAIEVTARPTLAGITDNDNFGAGATNRTVTLAGTNLRSDATVAFTRAGDTSGTQVTIASRVSSNLGAQLQVGIAIAASAITGARSISVTNLDGGTATLANAFTVNPPPVISSITPAGLGAGRTYLVTLRGSNLQSSNVGVTVGSGSAYAATVNMSLDASIGAPTLVNSTTVTFGIRIDADAPVGYRTITLTNLDGGIASTGFSVNSLAFSAVAPQALGVGAVAFPVQVTGQGFFSTSGLTPRVRFLNVSTLVADPLVAVDDARTSVNADGTQLTVQVTVSSTATLGARALSIDLQDPGGTPLVVTRSSLACAQGSAGVGTPTPTPVATCQVFTILGGPTVLAVSPRGRRLGAVDEAYPTVTPTTTPVAGGPTSTPTVTPSPTATLVPGQSAAPACPQPNEPAPETTMRIAVCGTNFDTGATVSISYPDSANAADNGITVLETVRKNDHLLWVLLKFDVTSVGNTTAKSGKRTITVTNGDGGTGSLLSSSNFAFEVVTVPTMTGVAYTGTPTAGQTVLLGVGATNKQVMIAGTGFVAGARTRLGFTLNTDGGIKVTSLVVNSSTSLTALISVGASVQVGARKLVLTNDDGGAAVTSALDLVMIVGGPSLSTAYVGEVGQVTVGRGATFVSLLISGAGFASGPVVSFGAGSGITVKPGLVAESGAAIRGQIDVDAGATPGTRDLTVTNADGGSFTLLGAITVNPSASLTGVSPASLGIGATGTVTVSGTNFRPGAAISFRLNDQVDSTIIVESMSWVNASRVDAVVKVASNANPGNRSLVFDNGDRSPLIVTAAGTFAVNTGPQFVYMSPDAIAQGSSLTDIVIAGTGFLPSLGVSISGAGVTVDSVTYVSSSVVRVTITVAAGADASVRDVILSNGDGSAVVTAPSRFTVVGGLVVTTVSPDSAVPGATLQVTITGNGYAPPAAVSFGDGITVSNVVVTSPTEITASLAVDAGAGSGARAVSVTVNARTVVGAGMFTVLGAPPPTAVPAAGPVGGAAPPPKPTAVPTETPQPTSTPVPTATPIPTATPYGLVGQPDGVRLQAAVAPAGQVGEASLGAPTQAQSSVNFVAPSGIGVVAVVEARDPATVTEASPVLRDAARPPAEGEAPSVSLRRSIQVSLYDNLSGRKLVEHQEPVVVRLAFDPVDLEAATGDPDRMGVVVIRLPEEATPACPAGVFVLPARFDGESQTLTVSTLCTSIFSVAVLSDIPEEPDRAIQGGWFYTQANGFGGRGGVGYAVIDDGQASFHVEFTRRGGVRALGYPASRRFVRDGFPVQVFQRYVLQWRADRNETLFVNVFDELHEKGYDAILESRYQIPPPFDIGPDLGLTFQEVVRLHVGNILTGRDLQGNDIPDLDPQVMRRLANHVLTDDDWLNHYGLPVSVARLPTSVVLRMQRATFQYWLEDMPFAAAGQVTTLLGGDIAKAVGLYRNEEVAPELSQAYPRAVAPTGTPEPVRPVTGRSTTAPDASTTAATWADGLAGAVRPAWEAVSSGVRRLLPDWLVGAARPGVLAG